jgi:hypothetical protein
MAAPPAASSPAASTAFASLNRALHSPRRPFGQV